MITGVAGLIGSHLAEKLLDLNYQVYGFDIVDAELSKNLSNIINNKGFIYYQGDITNNNDLNNFFLLH